MRKLTRGKLLGKTIELDEDPGLSQGRQVEVAVTVSLVSDKPESGSPAISSSAVHGDQPPRRSIAISDDARRFCHENRIATAVETALSLAEKHFRPNIPMTIQLSGDPEWDEQWVVVRVATAGSVESASKAYEQFLREWVDNANGETRKLIRLSYELE